MSFSFRSLFQRDPGSDEPGPNAPQHFARAHSHGMAGASSNSLPPMQASPTLQPSSGASPFQIGGNPLFKIAGNESISAPPINSAMGMSPFSVAGATPTNAPLTVGDVINQLPPELVRAGALPAEQPLSLPPALLENALRSGQAALPVFELYRVCPALFQMPISPQDPRLVALPAAKLPGLIAQAREGHAAAPAPDAVSAPSPFSISQAATPPHAPANSPFQMAQPAAESTPPSAQAFPMSPFAAASSGFTTPEPAPAPQPSPFSIKSAPEAPAASPFSMIQPAPQQAPASPSTSPFSLGVTANGSPFGVSQSPPSSASPPLTSPLSPAPAANPSPFSTAASNPEASPFPQASISSLFTPKSPERASTPADMPAAPAMPFGSPFAAAMKEAAPKVEQPTAAPAFASAQQPTAPSPTPAPSGLPSASGMAKLGFSAVLSGYSVEELGFNPTTLPAWITTSVPASVLNEQISSGNIILELGALIDGVSDIGFRNTLSSAKRDFKVKLPHNEVFHSLTNMAAAPAPQAPFGGASPAESAPRPSAPQNHAFVVQPGASAGQVSRVETSPPPSFSTPAAQPGTPQQFPQSPLSAFASPSAPKEAFLAQSAASSPLVPMSGAALNPFAQSQPATTPPPSPAFGSAPSAEAPSPFAFTPPAAVEPPRPQPSPVSSSLFSAAAQPAPPSTPIQPMTGTFQPFGAQAAPAAAQPSSPLVPMTKPFDPFASSSTGSLQSKVPAETGLSSAQLLGQSPASPPFAGTFSPAPEIKSFADIPAAPAPFQPTPSFAPALEEIPSFASPAPAHKPATRGLFSTQSPTSTPLFAQPSSQPLLQPQPKPEPSPSPSPAPAAQASPPAKMAAVKHSFLGLAPLDTQTDQLLLRALLGTEENLSAPRVVELLALQRPQCLCLPAWLACAQPR
jgi:hypothetical protein